MTKMARTLATCREKAAFFIAILIRFLQFFQQLKDESKLVIPAKQFLVSWLVADVICSFSWSKFHSTTKVSFLGHMKKKKNYQLQRSNEINNIVAKVK
jgi:hypothetical protein